MTSSFDELCTASNGLRFLLYDSKGMDLVYTPQAGCRIYSVVFEQIHLEAGMSGRYL
jgi:hypothetical protein